MAIIKIVASVLTPAATKFDVKSPSFLMILEMLKTTE